MRIRNKVIKTKLSSLGRKEGQVKNNLVLKKQFNREKKARKIDI